MPKKIPIRQCLGCREHKPKKELIRVVRSPEGEISLEEAVRILKRDTRHFAKRQLTWFRREKDVIWIEKEKFDYDEKKILDYMLTLCKKQGIYENEG